jgi:long-chain fatty acid transport protein
LGDALGASGLPDSDLKSNVDLPAQLAVGAYHELTQDLTLVATANWQNWSKFGEPEIGVADENTVKVNLNYKDICHAGLGAYYRVAEPWLLAVGFGYDTSPTSSATERSPVLARWARRSAMRPACTVRLEQGSLPGGGIHPYRRGNGQDQPNGRASQGRPQGGI